MLQNCYVYLPAFCFALHDYQKNNGSRNQWPKTSSMQKQGAKEVSCEDSTPGRH